MTSASLAYDSGAGENLTPLGERRRRLPLQRKVKQLERPWQRVDTEQRVEAARKLTWASSKQRIKDERRPGVRPRSSALVACRNRCKNGGRRTRNTASAGSSTSARYTFTPSSRRRPSTGLSWSPGNLRRPKSQADRIEHIRSESEPVLWGVSRAAASITADTERGHAVAIRGLGYRSDTCGVSGARDSGDVGKIGTKGSLRTLADAVLTSGVDSPFFIPESLITPTGCVTENTAIGEDAKASSKNNHDRNDGNVNDDDGEDDDRNDDDTGNNRSNVSLGSLDHFPPTCGGDDGIGVDAGVRGTSAKAKRPSSAGVSTSLRASANAFAATGAKVARPKTAHLGSHGRTSETPLFLKEGSTRRRDGTMTCWGKEGLDAGSSIECRTSVSVILPTLEDENITASDRRFWPGSATKRSTFEGSEEDEKGIPQAFNATDAAAEAERALEGGAGNHGCRSSISGSNPLVIARAPHINALGYCVEDSRRYATSSVAALHGRALVGNHRPRSPSFKRPLPRPPAVSPGKQPYGAAHPLSPTSMGNPPRRHRNSNWGEEGTRLAEEEVQNSRRTAPFIVSGTMLGWKLSTRERKKSLEESLKTSDYSDHHLIPVYGFCRNINAENGNETGGRRRYGGVIGGEERRMELRRLEARALGAERKSMERRARAEGGASGAAFARAMSRRALAKAEWIQKMGDVFDVRKDKVCRGSSPEIITAYRKRVRDRLNDERQRQRSARGLPLRRPPRISAVTSRADYVLATAQVEGDGPATGSNIHGAKAARKRVDIGRRGGCDGDGVTLNDPEREPYLTLVRAKTRDFRGEEAMRGGKRNGALSIATVPFCSQCLGGCEGGCSPDGSTRENLSGGSARRVARDE